MTAFQMTVYRSVDSAQRGMALLMSLVFLLLLTLIGISSMQNATLQEKMAGSLSLRNQSFQAAEAALRIGESTVLRAADGLTVCATGAQCAPPAESEAVTVAGHNTASGVVWVAVGEGVYGVQKLGTTLSAVNLPSNTAATLYRITAVGLAGKSRTVLESIYATFTAPGSGKMLDYALFDTLVDSSDIVAGGGSRRIMWRQVQ